MCGDFYTDPDHCFNLDHPFPRKGAFGNFTWKRWEIQTGIINI